MDKNSGMFSKKDNVVRKLPPLTSLAAFEALANLGGVVAAGQELNLTPSAISKQVANLERWAGRKLFLRPGRSLELTALGEDFLSEVTASLDRLELASTRLRSEQGAVDLRVSAPPTFTMYWLLPRLGDFQMENPKVRIQLDSRRDRAGGPPQGSDVAVFRGAPTGRHLESMRLMSEMISPVCSPSMPRRSSLKSPEDLEGHVLLQAALRPRDWGQWLEAASLPHFTPKQVLLFDHTYLALEAAMDGLGVAMAPLFLIGRDLEEGKLEVLFKSSVSDAAGYYAVCSPKKRNDPSVASFVSWLRTRTREYEESVTHRLCDQRASNVSKRTTVGRKRIS
jgi:LysR family glycine cleavage system transcriptional activator